jgi:hypothetical protein
VRVRACPGALGTKNGRVGNDQGWKLSILHVAYQDSAGTEKLKNCIGRCIVSYLRQFGRAILVADVSAACKKRDLAGEQAGRGLQCGRNFRPMTAMWAPVGALVPPGSGAGSSGCPVVRGNWRQAILPPISGQHSTSPATASNTPPLDLHS